VIDDVRKLVGKQAKVERVKHGAHARNRKISFKVFLCIPAEGSNSVAPADAQSLQSGGKPLGALRNMVIICAARVRAHEGYYLAVTMNSTAMFENCVDRQRTILHRALHRTPRRKGAVAIIFKSPPESNLSDKLPIR
jgi:hypothetical protein